MTKKLPVILAAAAAPRSRSFRAACGAQQVTVRVDTPEFGFRIGMPVYPAPVLIATGSGLCASASRLHSRRPASFIRRRRLCATARGHGPN